MGRLPQPPSSKNVPPLEVFFQRVGTPEKMVVAWKLDDPASFSGANTSTSGGYQMHPAWNCHTVACLAGKGSGGSEMATCLTERTQANMPCSTGFWWVDLARATTSDNKQKGNKHTKHSKYANVSH